MRKTRWIATLWMTLHIFSPFPMAQEAEERSGQTGTSREIMASTLALEQAVNGKAVVRNRCRAQGKDSEIEEAAEVIQRDRCKLVFRARKATRAAGAQDTKQEIEFMLYTDLSELTTPVLLETQKFGQCEATGAPVLKVSSRSAPGKAIQVTRRSHVNGEPTKDTDVQQTRRDLSLFFLRPAAAEKARKALERAVQSCGGKEWPDEDDLP